jgi:ribokinase
VSPRVLVVGYLSIDTLATVSGRRADVPGGAALYAALAARQAGAAVSIAACIGEDYPRAWLDRIVALGIDLSRVMQVGGATRRARLIHRASGERLSDHFADPLWWERTAALAPVIAGDVSGSDIVVAAPVPIASLERVARLADRSSVPVIADTSEAFAARFGTDLLDLLPKIALFAPSREETRILCPGSTDDAAVHILAGRGPSIVQKRGADGLAVCEREGEALFLQPAEATTVVDPTGAGDALVGALAAGLASGRSLREALSMAGGVAALTVSGIGPTALGLALDDHPGWEARNCA